MDIDQKMLGSFVQRHTHEVLRMIESVDDNITAELLGSISLELSVTLIDQMDLSIAVNVLKKLPLNSVAEIIEQLSVDKSEALLRNMDEDLSCSVLEQIAPDLQKSLKSLLAHSRDVVGAHLDPLPFTLTKDLTAREALERIKKLNPKVQSSVFVLDRQQHLVGSVELKDLIIADGDKLVQSVMKTDPPHVLAHINISSVFKGPLESYVQLPVVNEAGKFLGIITKDRLANVQADKPSLKNEVGQAGSALAELFLVGFTSLVRSSTGMTNYPDHK
jgi:magnesium transporter